MSQRITFTHSIDKSEKVDVLREGTNYNRTFYA